MRIEELSFRSGKEILAKQPEIYASVLAALVNAQAAYRKGATSSEVNHLHREFVAEGWIRNARSEPSFSFLKDRVAIQIEYSRREYLFHSYLRFLAAYKLKEIDIAVLITPLKSRASRAQNKKVAASFASVEADLVWLHGIIKVPIWVVALK